MLQTILSSIVDTKVLATLETVLGLILADFILGVLVSLRNGNFSASKLPQFVQTSLIPYIGGLLVLGLFSNANAELGALFFTIAATITVKFLADITTKATQLFSGFQIQIQSPINVTSVVQSQAASSGTNDTNDIASIPTEQEPVNTAPVATTDMTFTGSVAAPQG